MDVQESHVNRPLKIFLKESKKSQKIDI